MASVNLEIGGTHARVASPRWVAKRLAAALKEHVVEQDAPLGFMVYPARLRAPHYVLVDRCGFALGYAANRGALLRLLGSHLAALMTPTDGLVRLRVRAIARHSTAALCLYPVLYAPSMGTQGLSGTGYALIDRVAIDVDPSSVRLVVTPAPWGDLRSGAQEAKSGQAGDGAQVTRVITTQPGLLSPAAIACRLADDALSGSRSEVLEAVCSIAERSTVTRTDLSELRDLPRVLADG